MFIPVSTSVPAPYSSSPMVESRLLLSGVPTTVQCHCGTSHSKSPTVELSSLGEPWLFFERNSPKGIAQALKPWNSHWSEPAAAPWGCPNNEINELQHPSKLPLKEKKLLLCRSSSVLQQEKKRLFAKQATISPHVNFDVPSHRLGDPIQRGTRRSEA